MNCYGSCKETTECKACEMYKYCKDAANPVISSNNCEYDDGRTNEEHKESLPNESRVLTSHDLSRALLKVTELLTKNPTRYKVMMSWLHDYDASPAKGRDGLIVGIARKLKINPRTATRHVQALSACPILSNVFKYTNCRIGDRKPDRGTEPVRTYTMKQGMLL